MDYKRRLLEILKNTFKHDDYKNLLQKEIVETIYRGKNDVCIYMPSGFGKSLCYQLPIVAKEGCFAIVISPSIAHAKIQVDYLRNIGIAAYALNTYSSKIWINKYIKSQIYSHNCTMKILYLTAELFTTSHFQFFFTNTSANVPAYVVIDEAHCVSSRSHDYKESYEKLEIIKKRFPSTPIIAVTATANDKVKVDISVILRMNSKAVFSMPVIRSNLYYDVHCLDNIVKPIDHLKQFIEKSLKSEDETVPKNKRNCGLIFCPNYHIAENLSKSLSSLGVSVLTYSKRFKTKTCEEVQDLWTSGEVQVLVTTSCFGKGISKQTVRFVVHWGAPLSYGHYYQESGRAGHDGKKSFCRIYYNSKELNSTYYGIQDKSDNNHPSQQTYKDTIRQSFVEIKESFKKLECRHVAICRYFDEAVSACKNRCDVCKSQFNNNEKLIVPRNEQKLHCKRKTENSKIFEDDKELLVQSASNNNMQNNVILSVHRSVDLSAESQLQIIRQKLYNVKEKTESVERQDQSKTDHSVDLSAESILKIIRQKLYNVKEKTESVDHSADLSAESLLKILRQKLYNVKENTETNRKTAECIELSDSDDSDIMLIE